MRCRFLPMGLTPLFVIVAVNFSIAADAATPNPSPSPKSPATATKDANVTDVPLIPRAKLFGNPQRARLRISPDGKRLAYIAPRDGVLNVWVAPVEELANARPVTNDRTTGIRSFYWTYSNRHLMYIQDKDGDEDFHLYLVDLESDQVKDLTPLENVRTRVEAVSERFPNEILIGLNDRPPHQLHDIYRVDLTTGERSDEPAFTLDRDQLDPGGAPFKPSGLAFHPATGELYVLSAVRRALIVLSPEGELRAAVALPARLYPQAEGIAFAPDGTLFISSEGDGTAGTLLRFLPLSDS